MTSGSMHNPCRYLKFPLSDVDIHLGSLLQHLHAGELFPPQNTRHMPSKVLLCLQKISIAGGKVSNLFYCRYSPLFSLRTFRTSRILRLQFEQSSPCSIYCPLLLEPKKAGCSGLARLHSREMRETCGQPAFWVHYARS